MFRSSSEYKTHLVSLAITHQIRVMEVTDLPPHEGTATPDLRLLMLPQIKDECSFVTALHEFGHLIAPYGSGISLGTLGDHWDPVHMRQCLVEEYAAWEWAEAETKRAGFEWTLTMEHVKILSLKSYQDQLKRAILMQQMSEVA